MPSKHIPVMVDEVMEYLNCRSGKIYVDGTLGGCGHARAILNRIKPDGVLIGLDQDEDAINHAKIALWEHQRITHLFRENFIYLGEILYQLSIPGVDGILLDLGISLDHFESSGRGFSFNREEPLDMRMDIRTPITAADILNTKEEKELADIFWSFGEERQASRIAKRIVEKRRLEPFHTTTQLVKVISECIPRQYRSEKIHPATRIFMALRIAVNRELEVLDTFMNQVPNWLNSGGRLCVISFHSLEDRIVKRRLNEFAASCICPPKVPQCMCNHQRVFRILTRKVVKPTQDEIRMNPMARSARLRAAEKF